MKLKNLENLIIVIHYFVSMYLLIFPILVIFNYDKFKLFNLGFGVVGVVLYALYKFKACPFTIWQNKIRRKLGLKEHESFKNHYIWRYFGFKVPVKIIAIYTFFSFVLMVARSV
tara:strand:- start:902 stop:1243 length:342 start_codon:yes stop_codon:yes gene_type:complete